MWSADKWEQYRLIDSADGEKLEYWGDYLLRRPDPQAVWSLKSDKRNFPSVGLLIIAI